MELSQKVKVASNYIALQEATCLVCGERFKYPKRGYRPMTCLKPRCQREYKARENLEIAENMRNYWMHLADRAEK